MNFGYKQDQVPKTYQPSFCIPKKPRDVHENRIVYGPVYTDFIDERSYCVSRYRNQSSGSGIGIGIGVINPMTCQESIGPNIEKETTEFNIYTKNEIRNKVSC